jgi:hypothetical protein
MKKIIHILITLLLIIIPFSKSLPANSFENHTLKGMNISCQTWGYEWATPEMKQSLLELKELGVNSFTFHPYARILNNGRIKYSNSPEQEHISVPLKWAKELNMKVMLKPHLAYWGSKFSWRGDINFKTNTEWKAFFKDYKDWILVQAQIAEKYNVDIFCIGVEYVHSIKYEKEWREIISEIRKVYYGKLTYGANWDTYSKVGFWDVLDFIGIQAYFPIVDDINPTELEIRTGWDKILNELKNFSNQKNKKILFTELGYNKSEYAGKEPWSSHESNSNDALITQQRCLSIALVKTEESPIIAGVFLWKWFPEIKKFRERENFNLQTPENKEIIAKFWNNKNSDIKNDSKLAK